MTVRPRLMRVRRRPDEMRTPGARIDGVRRIVVVRHDRLGDLVLSLPAVEALRRTYPDARMSLMVRREQTAFAGMVPGVDEVVGASDTASGLRDQFASIDADLAVCISRGVSIARAVAGTSTPHRVGTGLRLYSPLFDRRVVEHRRHGERHECEYALSFAHRAGARGGPAVFPIEIPEHAVEEAARWLAGHGLEGSFVLMHPGSGGSCPAWPAARFLELAGLLVAAGVAVALSIGPADRRFDALFDAAPAAVRDLPRTAAGVEVLTALLGRAALVVSNSTGPLHVAAALGTPTLGFYPPWPTCSVARWGPYASNGWGLVAASESAESWSRSRRRRDGEALLGRIDAGVALRCARDLLEGREPSIA